MSGFRHAPQNFYGFLARCLRSVDLEDQFPEDLLAFPLIDRLGMAVPMSDPAVAIGGNHGIANVIEEGCLKLKLAVQFDALRVVFDDYGQHGLAAPISRRHRGRAPDADNMPVLVNVPATGRIAAIMAPGEGRHSLPARGCIFRHHETPHGKPDQLIAGPADQPAIAVVAVEDPAQAIDDEEADCSIRKRGTKPFLARKPRFRGAHVVFIIVRSGTSRHKTPGGKDVLRALE